MESKQIEEEREKISKTLNERLERHDESRKAVQEKLLEICEELRAQIKGLEGKVGGALEEKFTAEDNRLQSAYEDLQMDGSGENISKVIQKAKAKLFVMQSYELVDHIFDEEGPVRKKMKTGRRGNEEAFDLSSLCELKTERQIVPEMVELMRPTNLRVFGTNKGAISLQFTCLGSDEVRVLSENGYENQVKYKCLLTKRGENESTEYDLEKIGGGRFKFTPRRLDKKSTYGVRVKMILGGKESEWSDEAIISGGTEMGAQKPSASGLNPEKLEEERENIKRILSERIEIHVESRKAVQEWLQEICEELRAQVDNLYEKVNSELEEKFTAEDNRLQTVLSGLRSSEGEGIPKVIQRAKTELLVEQTYDVIERNPDENESDDQKSRISSLYELKTERKVTSLELITFEERKPTNLIPSFTKNGELSPSFTFFDEDEVEVLKEVDSPFEAEVKVWEKGKEYTSRTLTTKIIPGEPVCFRSIFTAMTTYCLKMRIVHKEVNTQWSDEAEFTPEFKECCVWKKCPYDVDGYRKYSVDVKNPGIATKIGDDGWCTIIGNTLLPLNKVTSWSIKILKSNYNDGGGIFIGVAQSCINQNESFNCEKCGWYLYCFNSTLFSGPPHYYDGKKYGPRKRFDGECVHTGDSAGVVMDTAKGDLSFVLNGVNLGIAYEGIPLDKPLVPCVLLSKQDDSVELVI